MWKNDALWAGKRLEDLLGMIFQCEMSFSEEFAILHFSFMQAAHSGV